MDLQFQGKYVISCNLVAVTGLHIGGSQEGIEIGGVDNPVIKDPLTDRPYIPGSSLKGKLRHLLEWSLGEVKLNPAHKAYSACGCGKCVPCRLFGSAPSNREAEKLKEEHGPTRLTVRDSFPTKETEEKWKQWLGENMTTEIKSENFLDRVTSEATPRTLERVPAGSEFAVEMIFDVYRADTDKDLLKSLFAAMHLLENSALGGSGSRGSGRVLFKGLKAEWRPVKEFYLEGGNGVSVQAKGTVAEVVKHFSSIDWKLPTNGASQENPTGGE